MIWERREGCGVVWRGTGGRGKCNTTITATIMHGIEGMGNKQHCHGVWRWIDIYLRQAG